MSIRQIILNGAVMATYALFGVASFLPLTSMWGMDHLMFLPSWSVYFYVAVGLLLLYLMFGRLPEDALRRMSEMIGNWLWEGPWWHRGIAALAAVCIFYIFTVETNLLGDGYTCIAEFGRGKAYFHKWAEPASIWVLRWTQAGLGEYTDRSALLAFRLLSYLSGGVFVFAVLGIIRRVCERFVTRWMMLGTLMFSGAMLLFFGYVEFYSLVWAASALFIYSAIRYVQEGRGLMFVLTMLVFAVAMHVQAIYFLPAVLYLIATQFASGRLRRIAVSGFVVVMAAGVALFFWLYHTRLAFEVLILPFFTARPEASGYTVFSLIHLLDLSNEMLLVIPAALVLAVQLEWGAIRRSWNRTDSFLLICSLGSVSFLLVFGAAITMGRDWDVMSLSFLAPLVLLFHLLDKQAISVKARNAILTVVLAASLTVPFLAVSIHTDSTERRFYTLLNNRSRNGWMIYANYFLLQKEMDKYKEIMGESYKRFPDYVLLQRGYRTLDAGDASKALPTAKQLIDTNPYNADFMQFLANVYEELNKNDSAEYYYQLALSIRPDLAPLLNELAQLYIKEGRYDEALRIERKAHTTDPRKTYISETLGLINIYLKRFDRADAIADSLFLADSTSPGGHLLKMTIALNKGLTEVARNHYEAYLKYGQGRSDYQSIKSYYSYLER